MVDRMFATFTEQITPMLAQMLLQVLTFHSGLGRQTFPCERASTIFALSEHTTGGHKLPECILKVLSSLGFGMALSIDSRDFLDPGDISRAYFFVDGR
jgi:hypothetical protein